MQPQTDGDYKKLLTEVIKKQIIILGPDITLVKARNVPGLTVADDGTVTQLNGNPQELIQKLIDQFMELSGMIVKKTMEPLLANYPGLAQVAVEAPIAQIPVAAPVVPQPTQPQPAPASPNLGGQPAQPTQPAQSSANTTNG